MMMKPQIFGTKKSEYQKSEFSVAIWQITSGRWEFLVHADRVLRFTMIVVLHMAQKVALLPMKIDISKSGTLFSCKTNVAQGEAKIVIQFLANFQQRVLILVLA